MLVRLVQARQLHRRAHTAALKMASSASEQERIPFTRPLPGGIPDTHRPHREANTTILVPKQNTAFLNPVQEYNRDLSVSVIRAWNEVRKQEIYGRWQAKQERVKNGKAKGKGKGKGKKPTDADGKEKDTEGGETAGAGSIPQADEAEPEAGPSTNNPFRTKSFTILEALSATGLRSIRYAKEIPDVKVVLANDLSPSACDAMRTNVALNGVGEPGNFPSDGTVPEAPSAEDDMFPEEQAMNAANGEGGEADVDPNDMGRRPGCNGYVHVNEGDACALMYSHRSPQTRVDVVDLDPYGTAAPFVDAAVGCIADGGLLAITCTDAAVLAGSQYPEKSFSNYGGVCVNAEYSHEVGLRLVLGMLANSAARYGRYITPLLSFSIDFYVRLFVRIDSGPEKVKSTASQMGVVYVCSYCQTAVQQPFGRVVEKQSAKGTPVNVYKSAQGPTASSTGCAECGSAQHLGGPMWLGPIQNSEFAAKVLEGIDGQQAQYKTWARMHGMLSLAKEELNDPFYFTMNKIYGLFNSSSAPSILAVHALLNAGYKVSRSHASQGSIKTNAPRSFILDIAREHIKEHPVRLDKLAEGSPVRRLLSKPMVHSIDFTPHPDSKLYVKQDKAVYYQVNPTPNWGPGLRAKVVKPQGGQAKRKAEAEGGDGLGGETAVDEQVKKAKTEE